MIRLDIKSIISEFVMLAGLDETEASVYENVALQAMKKTEASLDTELLTQSNVSACEHLAACEAVYELALMRCAGERYIVSADGRAGQRLESMSRVEAAKKLRDEARARVGELISDGSFVFALTDG